MTDAAIIELYWRRDERAIRESDAQYGKYCFTIASNILRSREDAEECVSDTWMRAWSAIPPQRPARLRLFFARITRNLSLNRYRAAAAEKRGGGEAARILDELSECVCGPDAAESEYMAKELGGAVRRFVRSLPEREGNVFVRRYFFSEAIADIAKRYGLTAHNVTVMLSRTRQKLRRCLEKEGFLE